jgi:hypothetical protein
MGSNWSTLRTKKKKRATSRGRSVITLTECPFLILWQKMHRGENVAKKNTHPVSAM